MLATQKHPEELNAWGDFFAGFFAPLAFLWLVLGYLQQGEELKHSTEALKLQAEELRNSVAQQSQLVSISREQVKQEQEALQEERERLKDIARPKFVLIPEGVGRREGGFVYFLRVSNVGNAATKIVMTFDPPLEEPKEYKVELLPRDKTFLVNLAFSLTAPSIGIIKYLDANGLPGEINFSVQGVLDKLEIGAIHRLA